VLTKPVDQVAAPDPAGREIQDQAFLVIDRGVDLAAVEDEERLHGGVPNTLVAIDKRVALDQRETQCRGFLNQRRIQIDALEGRLGLGDRGLKCAKIADAGGAPGGFEETAMQFDDLAECEIPHQARRRYNSSFFRSTRSAAALKSSPGVARRSAIAARARSSGARPSRSASWRSRSTCAGERSMVSFMQIVYRDAALSNNPLQRAGPGRGEMSGPDRRGIDHQVAERRQRGWVAG